MTTLREAAQQALEALESMTRHFGFARLGSSSLADTMKRGDAHVAINNLRVALAEPVQEPVAWMGAHDRTDLYYCKPTQADVVPLYTAPPQRKPVQEPQCNPHPKAPHGFLRNASHTEDRYVCECEYWDPYEAGYQAGIERAHGIGGQP